MNNMKKITNTMKVVASTKLTRATRAMEDSRKYGETAKEVFDAAETKVPETEEKKSLIIVCSSDRGLCGGIHSGLSRYIRRLFASEGASDLVVIGEKCRAQLSRSNPEDLKLTFSGIGRNVPSFADAQAIADQISLLPTEYSEVKILYNKFLNAQSYEPSFIEAFSEEAITQSRKFTDTQIMQFSFASANLTTPSQLLCF
jgi:F-type H+-transporting ATPase subunit gamma